MVRILGFLTTRAPGEQTQGFYSTPPPDPNAVPSYVVLNGQEKGILYHASWKVV